MILTWLPVVWLSVASPALDDQETQDSLTWETDLDRARVLAREQDRPLLLVFR